jgi:hypothetical protein
LDDVTLSDSQRRIYGKTNAARRVCRSALAAAHLIARLHGGERAA